MTPKKLWHETSGELICIFSAIILLILTPVVHHLLIISYSLVSLDGLFLFAGAALVAAFLTFLTRYRGNWGYALIVGGTASLLVDYFLDPQSGKLFWWIGLSIGIGFLLWRLGPKSAQIIIAFNLAFITIDLTTNHETTNLRSYEASAKPTTVRYGNNISRPVIHLVFDAFQAPSALPAEQAATSEHIRSYFIDNGFYLYDNAFSRHNGTQRSLSAALNFTPTPENADSTPSRISNSKYFEFFLEQNAALASTTNLGLNAFIVQSGFMDFCVPQSKQTTIKCFTYSKNEIPYEKMHHMLVANRLELLLLLIGQESTALKNIREVINDIFGGIIPYVRSPLSGFAATEITKKIIDTADAKAYIFLHSLMSHSPYALDKDCLLQPVSDWSNDRRNKNKQQREIAYQRYAQQLECSLKHISNILDGIAQNPALENALIIIHGDHGSRLSAHKADYRAGDDLNSDDLLDNFPTLFAVKHPDTIPGLEQKPVALDTLLLHHLKNMESRPYSGPPEYQIFLQQADGTLSQATLNRAKP